MSSMKRPERVSTGPGGTPALAVRLHGQPAFSGVGWGGNIYGKDALVFSLYGLLNHTAS